MVRVIVCLMLLATCVPAWSRVPPPSIDALGTMSFPGVARFERNLAAGRSFNSHLVSYDSAGLKLYAYVAVPRTAMPARGYPVVMANHGTHPDPPRYGFTAAGIDSRPGDYYRAVPELYTAHGFMVVMPDYRGHNVSEGGEYARGFLASSYYAQDVLALLAVLPTLGRADAANVFMWGHSLGGEVTLKALLATDRVRAASLWSTVGGDLWERAYIYSQRRAVDGSRDGSDVAKDAVAELRKDIDSLGAQFDWRATEPLHFLDRLQAPLILHHASGDEGALYDWSRRLAAALYASGRRYEFHSYPGTDHFFQGDDRLRAAERDVQFFRKLMTVSE